MLRKEISQSNGDLRITNADDQNEVFSSERQQDELDQISKKEYQIQGASKLLIGSVDQFFVIRENQRLEQQIFSSIADLQNHKEKHDRIQQRLKSALLNSKHLQQVAKGLEQIASTQNALIKQLCTLNNKIVSILKDKRKAIGKLVKVNKVHQQKEADLIIQISSLKSLLDQKQINSKNCVDISISTEPAVQSDQGIQTFLEQSSNQTQTEEKQVKEIGISVESRKFNIFQANSFNYYQEMEEKNGTEMTEEDEGVNNTINFIDKDSSRHLVAYLKHIATTKNEVTYNSQVIDDLQKISQGNEVARAFLRLLKEHKYLKLCMEKLLEKDRLLEEENNQRIIQMYSQAVEGANLSDKKQEQCYCEPTLIQKIDPSVFQPILNSVQIDQQFQNLLCSYKKIA